MGPFSSEAVVAAEIQKTENLRVLTPSQAYSRAISVFLFSNSRSAKIMKLGLVLTCPVPPGPQSIAILPAIEFVFESFARNRDSLIAGNSLSPPGKRRFLPKGSVENGAINACQKHSRVRRRSISITLCNTGTCTFHEVFNGSSNCLVVALISTAIFPHVSMVNLQSCFGVRQVLKCRRPVFEYVNKSVSG